MVSNILKSEKVRFVSRTAIALLLIPLCAVYIYFIGLILMPLSYHSTFFDLQNNFNDLVKIHGIFFIFTFTPQFIGTYLYLKFLGVLKKSDKLTFIFAFVIIVLGSILGYFCFNFMNFKNILLYKVEIILFIPVFLLHRFFNFLTKKFPIPFEKIGYYTSIECLNDFYNNHKNHKQIEETKEIEKTSFIHKILKSEKFNFTLRTLIAFLLFSICKTYLLMTSVDFFSFICSVPLIFMPHPLFEFSIPILTISFMFIGPYVAIYLYLKIFGILKQSDKLNSFFVLFVFFIGFCIDYTCFYLQNRKDIVFYSMLLVGFFLAFFLHKFFNFLTKKFPTPFEQIGYYTSIEFVKDLLRPMVRKIKRKN